MAYSELIKSFDRIRDYMRQFYIYGFKSRTEYDKKSARSYDNERRRLESWLGDYMRFRQTPDGKNVFLCVDSRSIPGNPLYNAVKAKSFTAGDVTFHFYILDLLQDETAYTAQEIVDLFNEKYLCHFQTDWQPDISTIRKKLKEYVSLGILQAEKKGRELYYRRSPDDVSLRAWADTAAFFSEANPLGVIGSTLLDQLNEKPNYYQFKHHYILHTLDSQIVLQLLEAIGDRMTIKLTNASQRRGGTNEVVHTVCPLQIFISTQGGRQYLLCYHYRFKKLMFFRLDYIQKVEATVAEKQYEKYMGFCEKFHSHLWGTSGGAGFTVDHLEMTLHFDYAKQPSKAMFKYRKAFYRNDGARYSEFLNKVSRGEAQLHADTLMPYELVEPYLSWNWTNRCYMRDISQEEKHTLNATWASLPSFASDENALAVIDTSGSMYDGGKPLPAAVALSLGLYFAEHNTGAFQNHFIEFSSKPQLIAVKGDTFADRLQYLTTFNEVADTNLEAVFDLILKAAVRNKVPQEELPATLYLISDMEFNCCVRNAGATNFENAKAKFAKYGYQLPWVVFWNVQSRNTQQPVTQNEQGVALVSGCTPRIFSMLTSGILSPMGYMLDILGTERYAKIAA